MEFEQALASIARAGTLADLSSILHEWRDESGVAHLVYHAVHVPEAPDPHPVLLLTYDAAWVSHYVEQDYFQIDPVVIAGRRSFLPVDWMTVDRASPAARHFFARAESFGVGRHGVTFPIRGSSGERALFTITSNESDHHWHRWRHSYLKEFHLLAHHMHDRAMQLAGLRSDDDMRPLSRRERQCLNILAAGRTPQQIADHLDISPSAVHLYLRSARRKMDCATVEQLVAKAICLDLVSYSRHA